MPTTTADCVQRNAGAGRTTAMAVRQHIADVRGYSAEEGHGCACELEFGILRGSASEIVGLHDFYSAPRRVGIEQKRDIPGFPHMPIIGHHGEAFVFFGDFLVLEKLLVARTGSRIPGKQQQPTGQKIQAVNGHYLRFLETTSQSLLHGIGHDAAVGSRRQKRWLVYDQKLIGVGHNCRLKGDVLLALVSGGIDLRSLTVLLEAPPRISVACGTSHGTLPFL